MELKDCFVVMPFSASASNSEEKWTEIFESFFKPAWNALDIDCYRTRVPRGSITKDIVEKLYSASIVFADLTDSNPNVMYELGVRHAFKKPSVMVKAKGSQIPFDVNVYSVFEYEYTPRGLDGLKDYLRRVIEDIQRNPNKADNPVWDYRSSSDFLMDYYRNRDSIQKLTAVSLELDRNLNLCNTLLKEIEGLDLSIDYSRMSKVEQTHLDKAITDFFPSVQNEALTHLRITRYIDFEDKHWAVFSQISDFYGWCRYYASNLELAEFAEHGKKKVDEMTDMIQGALDVIGARIDEMRKESPP